MVKYNLQTRIKGAIRQVARYHPQTLECLNNSVHIITGPRGGKMFECQDCHNAFKRTEVQIDHIEPVIPVNKKTEDLDWNTIIDRMFCGSENLQVLCKPCHKNKSKEERLARKAWRDSLKPKHL